MMTRIIAIEQMFSLVVSGFVLLSVAGIEGSPNDRKLNGVAHGNIKIVIEKHERYIGSDSFSLTGMVLAGYDLRSLKEQWSSEQKESSTGA